MEDMQGRSAGFAAIWPKRCDAPDVNQSSLLITARSRPGAATNSSVSFTDTWSAKATGLPWLLHTWYHEGGALGHMNNVSTSTGRYLLEDRNLGYWPLAYGKVLWVFPRPPLPWRMSDWTSNHCEMAGSTQGKTIINCISLREETGDTHRVGLGRACG